MLSPLPSVNARRSALSRSLNTGARAMPNSVRRINFASLTEKRRKPDQQMIGAASKRSRMLETSRTRQEGECQKNRIPVGEIATFRWGNPTPKTERYRWGKSPLQPYLKSTLDIWGWGRTQRAKAAREARPWNARERIRRYTRIWATRCNAQAQGGTASDGAGRANPKW